MSEHEIIPDGWVRHSFTGLVLPRGAVLSTQLTAEELAELEHRCEARGVRKACAGDRRVRRSVADAALLDAVSTWCCDHGLSIIGSVSFSDEYAARHHIYSLKAALDDVTYGLRDVSLPGKRHPGFQGRYVLAGEWHPSGREVPHIHMAVESIGNPSRLCSDLYRYFFRTRGRSRFEPMRDATEGSLYALKDVLKSDRQTSDGYRFRMHRKRELS